jgi:hypothetical protein
MKYLLLILLPLALMLAPAQQAGTLPVCSAAVHDKYTTTGPDGAKYATWHPQIDAIGGCRFDHEHGSNPAQFGAVGTSYPRPAFGYTAKAMPEGHTGFKVFVFEHGGYRWMFTAHLGSANAVAAACARYHTVDVVLRQPGGPILADVHYMADFGDSRVSGSSIRLVPAACPEQAQIVGGGNRQIPVAALGQNGYEPWVIGGENVFGFALGSALTFNTYDPMTACDTITCTANVQLWRTFPNTTPTPSKGVYRFITWNSQGLGFTSAISGTFYTDMHGTTVVPEGTAGALKQYIAPGLNFRTALMFGKCRPEGRVDPVYVCGLASWDSEIHTMLNPFITGAN